jgi:hypothetical protein
MNALALSTIIFVTTLGGVFLGTLMISSAPLRIALGTM